MVGCPTSAKNMVGCPTSAKKRCGMSHISKKKKKKQSVDRINQYYYLDLCFYFHKCVRTRHFHSAKAYLNDQMIKWPSVTSFGCQISAQVNRCQQPISSQKGRFFCWPAHQQPNLYSIAK
jgi:hypothetical protein